MTTPALTIWLRLADPGLSAAARRIQSELENAGVTIADGGPSGIVVAASAGQAWPYSCPRHDDSRVLALLATATPPSAAQLWKLIDAGAADALWWPADATAQKQALEQVLARLRRWQAVRQLQESALVSRNLVGASPAWRSLVREVVEVAAFTQSPVLITGETGTGKDLIAHLIHQLGGGQGELTILDCTTLSPELAGSELFGHERGAYTGAQGARDGAFALAHEGTLFLDEVGELPLPLQAQLLRVLQEQQYKRVGSNSWQRSRFRLVCATNRDLEAEVDRGAFRADLYYRIAAWRCRPPPLRDRRDDILPLAAHFLQQLAPGGAQPELDPAVREFLLSRAYPGNVRDLRQTVARIWHRHCGPGPITIGALPPEERPARPGAGDSGSCGPQAWPDRQFEDAVRNALALGHGLVRIGQAAGDVALRIVLEQEDGNNQRAALRLGVTDRALQIRRKARVNDQA
jgi:transcriptional regulator with GAF, ATPase, and Fis domain